MKRKQDSNIKMPAVKKVLISCFLCAAVLVSGFTAYSLMMPAKTATDEQEVEISTVHIHTDDCYRMGRKLVCKSTDEDHIHSEECYEERKILVCRNGEDEDKAEDNTETITEASTEIKAQVITEVDTEASTETAGIQEATTLSEKASGGETSKEQATTGEKSIPQKSSKAAAEEASAADVNTYTDFVQYIESRGGTISGVLRDSRGNYIRFIYGEEGDGYSYTITFSTKNGIEAGNYKYELPEGLSVTEASRTGEIKFGNSVVGLFEVDEATGLLILRLSEEAVHYQDVRGTLNLAASMIASSGVEKRGYIKSESGIFDGYFHFEISARIPAAKTNMLKCEWKLSDESYSPNLRKTWSYGFGTKVYEEKPDICISYGNVSKRKIKDIEEAYNDANESIAYYVDTDNMELYLVNRCSCESDGAECISRDSNGCKSVLPEKYDGWCTCWNLTENAVVDISYKNNINGYEFERDQARYPDKSIEDLKKDNGILTSQNDITENDVYNNKVTLKGRNRQGSNSQEASANVALFKFMSKDETTVADENNNYVGKFEVIVNPGKLDISSLAKPNKDGVNVFTLNDTMQNLRYIKGSVQITAENEAGDIFDLVYGEDKDYIVIDTYDPDLNTGNVEIQIMNIGAYKYDIKYSARIDGDTDDDMVEIKNDVSISEGDQGTGGGVIRYGYAREAYYNSFYAQKYDVTVHKTDKNDARNLGRAEYGLYAEDGKLIAQHTTNAEGLLSFATDVVEGIIYELDKPYYIQEITPPEGYSLDTKKYWFYFSASQNSELKQSFDINHTGEGELKYISPESSDATSYKLNLELTDEKVYILPETGGAGSEIFIVSGICMICTAFGLMIIVKKIKRKKI